MTRPASAARGPAAAPSGPAPPGPARQLSLLAAGLAPPRVEDLEGLLCGTGHVVRGPGSEPDAARISVLVDEPWRVQALEARLDELGLLDPSQPSPTPSRPDAVSVRTRFDARLLPIARRWTRGATPVAPVPVSLDGPALWWWAVAAGTVEQGGAAKTGAYRLRMAPSAPERWAAVGAALAEAGVPGIFLGPRADGPAYRLVGVRRLARLVDLVGEAPAGAPSGAWPSGSLAAARSGPVRASRIPEPTRKPEPTAATTDRSASRPAPSGQTALETDS